MVEFLSSLDLVHFSPQLYHEIEAKPPVIGLALSGGGYRSMLTGTGFIKQMSDWKLFDSLTYVSGLSGGSWILMDLITHDFEVDLMLTDWNLNDGLLQGIPDFVVRQKDLVSGIEESDLTEEALLKRDWSGFDNEEFREFREILDMEVAFFDEEMNDEGLGKRGLNPLLRLRQLLFDDDDEVKEPLKKSLEDKNDTAQIKSWKSVKRIIQFYIDLHMEVRPKKVKGFPVSFTDYLGKAFIRNLGNNVTNMLNGSSFSRLFRESKSFKDFKAPIPIVVANCKNERLKNVIFEFTPFEFGSWNPLLRLFVKLEYLGSRIRSGKAERCVKNFDDVGFITATSSSIFNNALIYIWNMTAKSSRETVKAIKTIMGLFGLEMAGTDSSDVRSSTLDQIKADYAVYHPNPFFNYPGVDSILTNNDHLYLVDGGEDGENIPLRPLLIPERKVDVVLILDSSSDNQNFPDGRKLKNVMNQLNPEKAWSFPELEFPLKHPLAFGCFDKDHPLLLYFSNGQHSYRSNTSTFKIVYDESEIGKMLNNGREVFSSDFDEHHRNCLGCLLIKRTLDRSAYLSEPSFCRDCYDEYCF